MIFLKNGLRVGVIFLIAGSFLGCKPKVVKLKSPPHYNFGEPVIEKIDNKLQEISGLTWDRKNDEFYAHNDEKGILFVLDREKKFILREIPFGKKGDYEDVSLYNGVPYVLRSDGTIFKIEIKSDGTGNGAEAGELDIKGSKDFETLYYDNTRKALIMLCKNCKIDDKETVSAFAFYPDSIGFVSEPVYQLDIERIKELAPQPTSRFQPSAACINPVNKKLYIVSSASNQLAIADSSGNIESVFVLAKKLFPQPEGITFKGNGDMYISNEGIGSKATIIKFFYTP